MKRIGLGLILAMLGISLLMLSTPAEASTVGLWLFDEGTGTSAYDSSGNGNTGTVNGPGWSADTPFIYTGNHSLSFDGGDDYVEVTGTGSSLNLTDAVSIEAWVKSSTAGSYDYVIAKYYNSGMASYALDTDSAKARFYVTTGGWYHQVTSTKDIWDGKWHHIAGTYDKDVLLGDNLNLYIDGDLAASGTTSGQMDITESMNFYIGNYGTGTSFNFPGKIDEVRVSDIALDSSQLGYHGSLIPEPATMSLLGISLLGLVGFRKRFIR